MKFDNDGASQTAQEHVYRAFSSIIMEIIYLVCDWSEPKSGS